MKVKEVKSIKEWSNDKGTVYYHNLVMENGDKINIGKRKKLSIGDQIDYEIIGDKDGNGNYQQEYPKAKTIQPFKPKFDTKGIEVGHAINNAVNMLCAGVVFENVDESLSTGNKIMEYARNILVISQKLKNE